MSIISRERNFWSILLCILLLAGCGGKDDENATPSGELQNDWRTEPVEEELELAKKEDKPAPVEASQDEPEKQNSSSNNSASQQRSMKPQAPQQIVSPVDKFTLTNNAPFSVKLVTVDNELVNRDTFAILDEPESSGSSTNHRIQLPKNNGENSRSSLFEIPDGFEEIEEAGYSESGWPLRIRCLKDESEMVYQDGGLAWLGSNEGPENAKPAVRTLVAPFYIDATEVTVKQYESFIKERKNDGVRIKSSDIQMRVDRITL
ncbi:MAG: SUMF1/EgtB/PvdO family nonheme iron enzyme [Planctomycetaceae bacterium]